MKKNKSISSNMEDYLEAITILNENNKVVRVRDIGSLMNVKNPSVTAALKTLSKDGLVIHQKYGYVELTTLGEKLAKNVKKRHDMLKKFLIEILGIDPKIAAQDACRMEHSLSPDTSNKLSKFIETLEREGWPRWVRRYC